MARRNDDGTVTFVRPAALPGTELLLAQQNNHNWRVFHERYVICTCDTAAAGWRYRGRSNFLDDGTYMLMEPGETHFTYQVNKRSDFQVLFLGTELIERFAQELAIPGLPHLRTAQDNDPALFSACKQLYAAIENGATSLEQESRLAVCAHLLLAHYAEHPAQPLLSTGAHRAVQRAKRYLHERFDQSVTLDELSAVAGLSRFHLLRTFAKYVGAPPHTYQNHLRIERARKLLQAGIPPSTIASLLGFADQSHFTRHFRQVMYVTPTRYAQARTVGAAPPR